MKLGTPLVINFKNGLLSQTSITLVINYQTTTAGKAAQWLGKESTRSGLYPFMFTQCEAANCRTLLPCQDTPSAKVTIRAAITAPSNLTALYSGIKTGSKVNGDGTTTTFYVQDNPVPSYLIAIAVGELSGMKVSDRVTVYAEPDWVKNCTDEFNSTTETFIQTAENYLNVQYAWTQYNILVLPPAFPYGGMENPTLTFATPSLIAGDKSLANVIAHEISHSWTGNLVTNKNWQNFWLNEGFTVFLERKITQLVYGEEMAKLEAMIGLKDLNDDLADMTEKGHVAYTKLHPDIGDVN